MSRIGIFRQQPHFSIIILCTLIWALVFSTGIETAYNVWIVSEIYNHCLLVGPIVAYLIWEKRNTLITQPIRPNYLLLLPFLIFLLIQLFGEIGDIKIIMHLATFSALPCLIWGTLGYQATRSIAFPLFFLLFSIPIGDQLVPYLQELTTDIAVPLLNMTGVPVYRNGLYLDIPAGQFLVAEACSGISFLITSVAFGFLYAYLFFKTKKKQILFIAVAILMPIAANALRVYGIILTAHLTDMEHAVGTDHLIYGGVFYAIILFLLILFGELIKEKKQENTSENQQVLTQSAVSWKGLTPFILLMALQQVWLFNATQISGVKFNDAFVRKADVSDLQISGPSGTWSPKINSELLQALIKVDQQEVFMAFDDGTLGTLISSNNRLYDQQQWSLLAQNSSSKMNQQAAIYWITAPSGEKRTLVKWHQVGDKLLASDAKARLLIAWNKMLGKANYAASFIVSFQGEVNVKDIKEQNLLTARQAIINKLSENAN